MDDNQRLHLQKMISANDVEDQTDFIRSLKHSDVLRKDVARLVELRKEHTDPDILHAEGTVQCNFLATYYTDIFNKVRKDVIDLTILDKIFDALSDIENGRCNQHDASFKVGTLLKNIYVDSALRTAEKLDSNQVDSASEPERPTDVKMSWREWREWKKPKN
jgi:hypothetical protein